MSLKIFHTSDIHLGMKFASYPEVQKELSEVRFSTLEKLVEIANTEASDIFAVAGDLFDRVTVSKRDVLKAAHTLNEFQGKLVLILPGNHDYLSPGGSDLWRNFREVAGDRILLLKEAKAYPLEHYDLDAILYAAPCTAKHSSENSIGWIAEVEKPESVKFLIGLAHGSLEGFSPDFEKRFYPMTRSELLSCGLDLWIIGHTHIQYPEFPESGDKIYYASTPEPDGFGCAHKGGAWIIELDDEKRINSKSISTGTYRFKQEVIELRSARDLEKLKSDRLAEEPLETLLKLRLVGRLQVESFGELPSIREKLSKEFCYLDWDDSQISKEITREIIEKEFTEGSLPYNLLTTLAKGGEKDFEALQMAYDLIDEVKE